MRTWGVTLLVPLLLTIASCAIYSDGKRDAILQADRSGDYEATEKLIDQQGDIDQQYRSTSRWPHPCFSTRGWPVTKTLLMIASEQGNERLASLLLRKGARVNVDSNGCTAIALASLAGYPEVIRLLASKGADVNIQPKDLINRGMTPLMAASSAGRQDVIRTLVKLGARTDLVDQDGGTALTHAARAGRVEAMKELVSLGAFVNQKNPKTGMTALIDTMLMYRQSEVIKTLLSLGADPNIPYMSPTLTGSAEQTALDIARTSGDQSLIEMLEQARAR